MENYNIITDGELRRIELSLLIPSPLNNYPIGDITSLMGSIKSCGLITPLSVIGPANDGTYTILFAASMAAGMTLKEVKRMLGITSAKEFPKEYDLVVRAHKKYNDMKSSIQSLFNPGKCYSRIYQEWHFLLIHRKQF